MKKTGITILSLLALIICGVLGYELYNNKVKDMSASSVKEEKWCIKLSDLGKVSLTGQAESTNPKLDHNVLKFNAKLTDTEDSISYQFRLKNCGTVDAYLYSIDLKGPESKDAILYVVDGIEVGDTMKPGEVIPLTAKVSSNDEEFKQMDLELSFNLSQVD